MDLEMPTGPFYGDAMKQALSPGEIKRGAKPIIKTTPASPPPPRGFIPLTAVGGTGKPL